MSELYKNPNKAGRVANIKGVKLIDCPIDRRTSANDHARWVSGWNAQSEIKCKGIEVEDKFFSGCLGMPDCPECRGEK